MKNLKKKRLKKNGLALHPLESTGTFYITPYAFLAAGDCSMSQFQSTLTHNEKVSVVVESLQRDGIQTNSHTPTQSQKKKKSTQILNGIWKH